MRLDHRRGETFHELRQAQEAAREGRNKKSPGMPPIVGRVFRIILVALFGVALLWLLRQAEVPPIMTTIAMAVVAFIIIGDIIRMIVD